MKPATKRRGVADASNAESQRLNVRINPESYKRLMVHCVMAGITPGRLVEQLIAENLKSWRVQAVQAKAAGAAMDNDRPAHGGDINPVDSAAA